MFINKFKENSGADSSKMTSYINLFLKTEVTCIPKLLKNYIGDYYNNALLNGATWVFILWCVLHIVFDKLIDAFLKKLRYREYVRLRLKNSLWYLGFYGTAVVYSSAALAQNEVELFNFKKMHVPSSSELPSQVVIGYTLISTFFLHSSLWEGLAKEYFLNMISYLFLFLLLVSSYILRVVEISFTLTALTGMAQVAVELTRCCFMSSTQESFFSKLFMGLIYFSTYLICFAVYFIVIPLTFVVPLGLKIMSDYPNMLLLFLYFNLGGWLLLEIYQSVLIKFLDHWFYHQEEKENDNFLHCSSGLLECSLFKPRDDISYNLQIIQKEIKARQAKMMSMRKPKNKAVLIQTLKCMVAIKRKINEKRKSESSDSESEKSEDSGLKPTRTLSTDEEDRELLSDQDEETDDESQESVLENERRKSGDIEQSDKNDSSEIDSKDSDVETDKEEETDKDTKLLENQEVDLQNNSVKSDNNNALDIKSIKQDNDTLIKTINEIQENDDQGVTDIEKLDTTTSKIEENTPDVDNNVTEIIESDKNVDNEQNNNSMTLKQDVPKEHLAQNKFVIKKLKVSSDRRPEEVKDEERN